MERAKMKINNLTVTVIVLVACQAGAEDAKTTYASMAPVEQYLIADRTENIFQLVAFRIFIRDQKSRHGVLALGFRFRNDSPGE